MAQQSPAALELVRLTEAYRKAVEDVMAADMHEVLRIAKLLEIEAQFQGMIEACREIIARQAGPGGKPN